MKKRYPLAGGIWLLIVLFVLLTQIFMGPPPKLIPVSEFLIAIGGMGIIGAIAHQRCNNGN